MATRTINVCDGCGLEVEQKPLAPKGMLSYQAPFQSQQGWAHLITTQPSGAQMVDDLCEKCAKTAYAAVNIKQPEPTPPSARESEFMRALLGGKLPPAVNLVGGALTEEDLKALGLKPE